MNQSSMDQIADGMTVYDSAGEKVGTIRQYDPQNGYIEVEKGWLFHKDFYVPLNAVARTDADGVYLNLYKDDLSDGRYDQPPTGYATTGATTGDYVATGTETTGYATTDTTIGTTAMDTTTGMAGTARTTQGMTTDTEDVAVPVYEEQLVAGKRQGQIGDVRVHKDVTEEQQTVPVNLRREEVTVERVPVQGGTVDPNAAQDAFQSADIDVPVMGEEAIVGKQAREVEEVRLRKQTIEDQQQVTDTVRKENVIVDSDTDQVTGDTNLNNPRR